MRAQTSGAKPGDDGGAGRRGPAIAGALAVTAAWLLVIFLASRILPSMAPRWMPDLGAVVINLIGAAVPLAVVTGRRWWRQIGLIGPRLERGWWWALPLVVLAVAVVVPGGWRGTATQLTSSAVLFMVLAANEELLSRGVVQRLGEPLGAVGSVALVAVLFGLQHAANGLFFGQALLTTAAQVVSAVVFGAAYAAVRRRMSSLWPLVFAHALEDFCLRHAAITVTAWWFATEAVIDLLYAAAVLGSDPEVIRSARSRPKPPPS